MGGSTARNARLGWMAVHTARLAALTLASALTLALALALCFAPRAAAATTFKWSGELATSNPLWSAPGNWASGVAPEASTTVAALEFPHTSFFFSVDDLPSLTAESLSIDDSQEYFIVGEPGDGITLGSGGLSTVPTEETTEPTTAELDLPITLGASQTWRIEGRGLAPINHLYLGAGVSGPANDALTVNLANEGTLYLAADNELGPVSITGSNAAQPGILNGVFGLLSGGLNATNGEPVDVSHAFFVGAGAVGALRTAEAELWLAILGRKHPNGTLEAASATLDSASRVTFEIAGTGNAPGSDYSRLLSRGAVDLGGSELVVRRTATCATLPPGQTYTLVSATGPVSGSFGNAPDGNEIPITFASNCGAVAQSLRLSYVRSGAAQTVVGTVIAGPGSSTALSSSPSTATTNQAVTLTAVVAPTPQVSTGTVEFQNDGAPIPGCAAQPVSGSSATCQTSFAAAGSPERLVAVFSPAAGVNLKGSTSATQLLTVTGDATTTTLATSGATALAGANVSYTATVSPAHAGATSPSGSVEFLDNAVAIAGCVNRPLAGSTASCQLNYPAPGTHLITARYSGDDNFAGSNAGVALTVTVLAAPGTAGGPVPVQPVAPAQQVAASSAEGGGVVLVGNSLRALSGGAAATVKLRCSAPRGCQGKLTLSAPFAVKAKHGKKHALHAVTIGTGSFAISPGATVTVKLKLNATARALLHSGHGRVTARLALVEVISGHNQTQFKTVSILEQTGAMTGKRRK